MRPGPGPAVPPDLPVSGPDGGGTPSVGWRAKAVAAALGTALLIAVAAGFWATSRLPRAYSIVDMGLIDTGGAQPPGRGVHGAHGMYAAGDPAAGSAVDVTDLVADPARPTDVRVDLTARQGATQLPDGRTIDGFSLNGATPGPTITAERGQLVEIAVHNVDVADGMTLHWHGIAVPNGADGVAGVTQDAIAPGEDYTYRFVAVDAGTYWYHSHQVSHEQSRGGLIGAVVVLPRSGSGAESDVVALAHTYEGVRTLNGRAGDSRIVAPPGATVRVRVVNTDPGPMPVWVSGAGYRVVAVDGRDVNRPEAVADRSLLVTAGGRADLVVRVPDRGAARVEVAGASLLLGDGPAPSTTAPREQVDLLHYGEPAPVGFDPDAADRRYRYDIGRRFGLLDGRPGMWWTINGQMYPDVPMFVIAEGDIGRFTISNDSGDVHPMHLHGHHMVVLSRDGERATGSPWWTDSLNVADGESYEVAFVADNPGVWMDHCHNLSHAAEGLVAHLMYEGVTTPFVIGGDHGNEPE